MALDPDILLCDEPTAGLDPITAREIDNLIAKAKRERGVSSVIVTHDLHSARIFSDRLVMLHGGKVLVDGSFEDLKNSGNEFVAQFLADAA